MMLGCGTSLESTAVIATDVDGASGIMGRVVRLLDGGIEPAQVAEIVKACNTMLMGDEASWSFNVKYKGNEEKLRLELKMAGISSPELHFFSSKALIDAIQKEIKAFEESHPDPL